MALTESEQRVIEAVDADTMVADLAELVAIPSVGGAPGEVHVQRWCAERLAAAGATVDHWPIDLSALRSTPGYPGEEVERDEAYGCVGVFGTGTQPPGLVLAGHTDVVPAGDPHSWRNGPWALHVDGGDLRGRGACDMKGGLAAIFAAVRALPAAGVTLSRPLAVHTVVGEEDGGVGAYATLERGHGGDRCVIAEPTDGCVVPANAGSLTFRLAVLGRAVHGSSRLDGTSALDAFLPVHAALRELEARRNGHVDPLLAHLKLPYAISIGIVRAGDWASTVPDSLVADGRYGVRLDESAADARAELEAAVAAACAADPWLAVNPVRVSWPGGAFASGRLPAGDPLAEQVSGVAAAILGTAPEVRGAPYGSDLRQYAAAGIPTVQFGPGVIAEAHAADESVPLADLVTSARVYAVLALRLCS